MFAFLKRWRQAYRDDKGDRLHSELEAERNALCHNPLDYTEVLSALKSEERRERFIKAWSKAADDLYEEGCRRGYH
ncbi:hypothetical protein [uncultured Vibrio sp.]|uniref:hypothetical protein n=1 Tax=uncultured Vibrio sp. TaxID=114054 RepID=UPI00262671A6|nr:hypothetical protein [uncultured Vibrio sp.]